MTIAATYIRVSTPGQAEDGLGLEAQREACRMIAERHDLDVVPEYSIEEQASGGYLERDGLDRLRQIVRAKEIEGLIVYDTDRICRDQLLVAWVLREAHEAGVAVYTLKGKVDTSDEGELIAYVMGYAAKLEREKIRQRTLDGKRASARAGILPVGAEIYGYDYVARVRGEHKRQQARVINDREAQVVRRMFGMALEGLGINTIAVTLNTEGIPAKKGGPWHARTVGNLLRNPAYAGLTRYGTHITKLLAKGKREVRKRDDGDIIMIEGFTPAIVDLATFERVQAHLARPRRSGHALSPYLLAGMLRCSCGCGLVGQSMKRGRYRYYTCRATSPTATRPQTCWSKRAKATDVDALVWEGVKRLLKDPDFLHARMVEILNRQTFSNSLENVSDGDKQASARARIRELAEEERNLVAALRTAPSAAASIGAELEKVAAERKALERSLAPKPAPQQDSAIPTIDQAAIRAFSEGVQRRLKTFDIADRHKLLASLAFEGTVQEGRIIEATIRISAGPYDQKTVSSTGQTWACSPDSAYVRVPLDLVATA